MAGGKLPPRQKMISMMYLVLTALLAMNVSKEVLNSFVVINDGLETTNDNFGSKNQMTYSEFEAAAAIDPIKAGPWQKKAQQVQNAANELVEHIESLKKEVIKVTAKYEDNVPDSMYWLRNVESKDNYDVPTLIMIGPEVASPKEGPFTAVELRQKIESYESKLVNLFEDPEKEKNIIAAVKAGLKLKEVPKPGSEGGTESWEAGNFYHLPLAAVITNLSKIQADVRNTEADVIKYLLSKIGSDDFKFDKVEARVIAPSNYIIIGDTFKAEVIVAAYSTTQDPELRIGVLDSNTMDVLEPDTAGVSVKDGIGQYSVKPTTEGETVWGGVIKVQKPNGDYQAYPFEHKYMAAKPTLVVSPTAMNVFYRGLDNPVDISVPGVPTEALKPSVTNGTLTSAGKKGSYIIRPGKGAESIVNVTAEMNGETKHFGDGMKFRVKNVPDPKASFAGESGSGTIPKAKLVAAAGVLAKMENFEFDLKFTVIEFTISMNYKGNLVEKQSKSNRVTAEMKDLLQASKRGSKVFIEGIKAKGPDGTVRNLGAISLKVL
jgi:gliding motility-associated protein GldM